MAAIGKFLEPSGITEALYKSGVYLMGAAENNIMKGLDYVQGKDGMAIIAELMTRLQYEGFQGDELFLPRKCFINMDEIKHDFDNVASYTYTTSSNDARFVEVRESSKSCASPLQKLFQEYQNTTENFVYWNIFLHNLFPTLRNFELSVRKGDWDLFLDAVLHSLPIFFATGCLDLQRKFPGLYRHFKNGMFVCNLTERSTSGIGFDQALEKAYNYTAKSGGGIIGITRKKKAVALWDVIKHEKDMFVSFIKDMAAIRGDNDELSLHHNFNPNAAIKS